jgi:hypothetical protein
MKVVRYQYIIDGAGASKRRPPPTADMAQWMAQVADWALGCITGCTSVRFELEDGRFLSVCRTSVALLSRHGTLRKMIPLSPAKGQILAPHDVWISEPELAFVVLLPPISSRGHA